MQQENLPWNQSLGLEGESLAVSYLKKQGFKIIDQRFRTRYGEIDLIAERKKCLYFVEVKYRKTREYGDPLEAITPGKIRHLKRAVYSFLQENPNFRKDYDLILAAIAIRDYDEQNRIEMVPIYP